jgi:hypothetical protein
MYETKIPKKIRNLMRDLRTVIVRDGDLYFTSKSHKLIEFKHENNYHIYIKKIYSGISSEYMENIKNNLYSSGVGYIYSCYKKQDNNKFFAKSCYYGGSTGGKKHGFGILSWYDGKS